MDGNGRWAQSRGLPRVVGHRAGAAAIRPVLERAEQLGVKVLTLYSFSSENWNRPTAEVDALMALCCEKLAQERAGLIESGIRLRRIGSRTGLPAEVLRELDITEAATAGGRNITLALALNYGSRGEITDALRAIATRVAAGEITAAQVTEDLVSSSLYTSDLPDPDLLIRTGGQMRLSNYLLWQLSYAEILFSNTLWPDFSPDDLCAAVDDFAHRKRTFGGIATETSAQSIPVGSHCVEQGGLS
ncbi:MAG: di-trans,poly-cis-decaprenylcistransferase [Phycisphaerales bacterium]|nr:di-trans,poly-cis-decaprenylcistransferase [Phycisphaerales bacterium]